MGNYKCKTARYICFRVLRGVSPKNLLRKETEKVLIGMVALKNVRWEETWRG